MPHTGCAVLLFAFAELMTLTHYHADDCRYTEACDAIELAVAISQVLADAEKTKALQADLAVMQQLKESSSEIVSLGQ